MSNKEHEGSFSIKAMFGKKRSVDAKAGQKDSSVERCEAKARSKSMDVVDEAESSNASCESRRVKWPELSLLKTMAPVVLCVLPYSAQDLVGSALLAVGASPVFPEDAEDIKQEMCNCKAVLVDTSARKELVEAFIEHYVPLYAPLVLNPMHAGTDDNKRCLAQRVMEKCDPSAVSGRMGDIYALTASLIEQDTGVLTPGEDCHDDSKALTKEKVSSRNSSESSGDEDRDKRNTACMTKQVAPVVKMARRSPSPYLHRNKTPLVLKKGHFRDESMKDMSVANALEGAQKLAARNSTIVHLYEPNILTSGEFFMEVNNTLLGMQNILSAQQCASAIIASVLGCVDEAGDSIALEHCSHAICFFTVAGEMASLVASKDSQIILPGTHRLKLIDFLYSLDEQSVRHQVTLIRHNKVPSF